MGVDLGRRALMSRRPPWTSSMIAMALLACGESVARAAPLDEQEQKRMEWARQQAKAEEHLPRLDELTRQAGSSRALQLVDMQLRHMKTQAPSEVIYQEYKDGKLTYEVTAPPTQIRALGMPPVMLIRPLDCPDAPRPAAKPRSKSGQRRAHARWGR